MAKAKKIECRTFKTLTHHTWPAEDFKKWKGSHRTFEPVIQRFISLNKDYFDFLGITSHLSGDLGNLHLLLSTSNYIGAVPILDPHFGLESGVVAVEGRYGENPAEVLSLIEHNLRPEYNYSWSIPFSPLISPPVFMECCAFIDLFMQLSKKPWNKFTNQYKISKTPSGSTQWGEYAVRSAVNPLQSDTFINKQNLLTAEHKERFQLNYVCQVAVDRLSRPDVPYSIISRYSRTIKYLQNQLRSSRKLAVNNIATHGSDPVVVKELKRLANIILSDSSGVHYAWRLDYADFFEKFVQYIFGEVARNRILEIRTNHHLNIQGARPAWGLRYLEPDIILSTRENDIIVDAKYKSHIYNWNDISDELHDTFRHDLHQVLAYSALGNNVKTAILAYPYSKFKSQTIRVEAHRPVTVHLMGIPISSNNLSEVISSISAII